MKSNITKSDFSIFDLSDWNPNVALELGLSEGLGVQIMGQPHADARVTGIARWLAASVAPVTID